MLEMMRALGRMAAREWFRQIEENKHEARGDLRSLLDRPAERTLD
jgi:hypothetical protein